jgi:hypothetical protein
LLLPVFPIGEGIRGVDGCTCIDLLFHFLLVEPTHEMY